MEDFNDLNYDMYPQPMPAMGTEDELREAMSLDPIEDGEKIKKNEIGLDADIRQLYREDVTKPWETWKEDAENERANHPKNSKYALVVSEIDCIVQRPLSAPIRKTLLWFRHSARTFASWSAKLMHYFPGPTSDEHRIR